MKESRFVWNRIRPNLVGDETFYEVHNREIRLQDSRIFQLSKYSQQTVMAFDIIEKGKRPPLAFFGIPDETISFEMNLDLEVAEREVYSLLDWIGSLGGFQRGLRTIFSLMLLIMTYKRYETYMVSKLF